MRTVKVVEIVRKGGLFFSFSLSKSLSVITTIDVTY